MTSVSSYSCLQEIDFITQRMQREKSHAGDELDRTSETECAQLDEELRKNSNLSDGLNGAHGDR